LGRRRKARVGDRKAEGGRRKAEVRGQKTEVVDIGMSHDIADILINTQLQLGDVSDKSY
jgi:hypothetical protein